MNEVVIGQIGAPHGVNGWVRLRSFMQDAADILNFQQLFIKRNDNTQQQVKIEQLRPHGKAFVAKLTGTVDRDQAALLTNCYVAVAREALPQLAASEHYWADLLQLELFDQTNNKLGVITDIIETGANDVLVVTADNQAEYLIPYVLDQYVLEVDLANKRVLVASENLDLETYD